MSTTTGQIRDTSFIGFTEEVNKVALSAEDDKRVCDAGRTATDMNESIIIAAKIV